MLVLPIPSSFEGPANHHPKRSMDVQNVSRPQHCLSRSGRLASKILWFQHCTGTAPEQLV